MKTTKQKVKSFEKHNKKFFKNPVWQAVQRYESRIRVAPQVDWAACPAQINAVGYSWLKGGLSRSVKRRFNVCVQKSQQGVRVSD